MRAQVKITSGFPSAAKAAKELGVSKKVARNLSLLAKRSLKTGEFVLPGVGRLVHAQGKPRGGRNPMSGEAMKGPTRRVAKFRVVKDTKDAVVLPRKK
jgi:DNA-binding protein HU-beta